MCLCKQGQSGYGVADARFQGYPSFNVELRVLLDFFKPKLKLLGNLDSLLPRRRYTSPAPAAAVAAGKGDGGRAKVSEGLIKVLCVLRGEEYFGGIEDGSPPPLPASETAALVAAFEKETGLTVSLDMLAFWADCDGLDCGKCFQIFGANQALDLEQYEDVVAGFEERQEEEAEDADSDDSDYEPLDYGVDPRKVLQIGFILDVDHEGVGHKIFTVCDASSPSWGKLFVYGGYPDPSSKLLDKTLVHLLHDVEVKFAKRDVDAMLDEDQWIDLRYWH